MTSFAEKSAISRLSSAEEISCCYYYVLLACWKPSWVASKIFSSFNLLYSNTKNILKLAHILSDIGFLRQSLHVSVYIL